VSNGWEGAIINGVIRDAAALSKLHLGVKALGTNPRKSNKHGAGQRDVPVAFGGAVFTPGHHVVSDEDGIVILEPDPTLSERPERAKIASQAYQSRSLSCRHSWYVASASSVTQASGQEENFTTTNSADSSMYSS
jgi:regulator of RNase E activity RraA